MPPTCKCVGGPLDGQHVRVHGIGIAFPREGGIYWRLPDAVHYEWRPGGNWGIEQNPLLYVEIVKDWPPKEPPTGIMGIR